jgi:hypothetical protein
LNITTKKTKPIFRFWLHTAFFGGSGEVKLMKSELDKANKDKKHKNFSKDFSVTLGYAPIPFPSPSSQQQAAAQGSTTTTTPTSGGGAKITPVEDREDEEYKQDDDEEEEEEEGDALGGNSMQDTFDVKKNLSAQQQGSKYNTSNKQSSSPPIQQVPTQTSWFESPFGTTLDLGGGLGGSGGGSDRDSLTGLGITTAFKDASDGVMGFGSNFGSNFGSSFSSLMSMSGGGGGGESS